MNLNFMTLYNKNLQWHIFQKVKYIIHKRLHFLKSNTGLKLARADQGSLKGIAYFYVGNGKGVAYFFKTHQANSNSLV